MRPLTREQRQLLGRFGIGRFDPWVWVSTDGPVTTDHARFRVAADTVEQKTPLTDAEQERWRDFGYDAVGVRLDPDQARLSAEHFGLIGPHGLIQRWADDLYIGVRWQRVRYRDSVLSAEMTFGEREGRRASIEGAHLKHPAADRTTSWKAMNLLLKGPQPGRPEGAVKGGEVERWVRRGREIGEQAARGEFKAETPPGRGAWDARYQWWYRHVRPRLQKPR